MKNEECRIENGKMKMEGEEGSWCEEEWVKKYFFCRVVENVPKIASGYFGAE
nr:hypothetical protein [Clostridia bacterium]